MSIRRARVDARALWAEEFYRTGSYLERKQLVADLQRLMTKDSPDCWVYQVHATGGTGKTMFLRWAIARWCLPRSIPCARIDFDFDNAAVLASEPATLALLIARQWNKQLPRSPLEPLIGRLATKSLGSLNPLQELANALTLPDGTNALLILDTLEEVLIPHKSQLIAILGHLNKLHSRSSGSRVRVILSGRYDLRKRLGENELALLGKAPIHRKIFRFKDREARRYLTELRGLHDDFENKDGRVRAVIERSSGNPLKLWLFSEIIKGEPDLTAPEIRVNVSVEVEWLIRRVVLRIGENQKDPATGEIPDLYKGLRWVLRYGSVPRRLTLDYLLATPIRRRLEDAITDEDAQRRAQGGIEKLSPPSGVFQRARTPPDFQALWEELRKYASGSSWVRLAADSAESETLVFTPDVLNPMRALLLEHEAKYFHDIHSEALGYFQSRADKASPASKQRARWLREVVYHDFQRRGEEAGPAWRASLLSEEFRDLPSCRRLLAEEVTGRSYVEDDDPPRSIVRKDKRLMIGPEDLAFAYYHWARAAADLALMESANAANHWTDAVDAFRRFEKTAALLSNPSDQPDPDAATILGAVIQANVSGGDKSGALAVLRAIESSRYDSPAEVFREEARLLELANDPDAERIYQKWLTRDAAVMPPGQLVEIREKLAKRQIAFDNFVDASTTCRQAIITARQLGPDSELLRARLDLLRKSISLDSGRPQDVLDAPLNLDEPAAADATLTPIHTAASWFFRARACLAQLDPHQALEIHREARGLRRKAAKASLAYPELLPEKPAERQLRAHIAAEFMDFSRALDELSKASSDWLKPNKPEYLELAAECLAKSTSITLHQLNDLTGTSSLLGQSRPTIETSPAKSESLLQLGLLNAELVARLGDLPRGLQLVDELLAACQLSPPRFCLRAALVGLFLAHQTAPARYFEALVEALARISPDSSRFRRLVPLSRCEVIHELPNELVDRFLSLIPDLPGMPLASRDRAVLALHKVEALRVVNRKQEAAELLAFARDVLLSQQPLPSGARATTFPLAQLLRSEDRLGLQSDACLRGVERLPGFAAEFSHDQERVLVATAWVDQAERAHFAGNEKALDEAIAEARRRIERTTITGMTWLGVRLHRLRADVAARRGFFDDQAQYQQSARGFEEILGIPARSATTTTLVLEGDDVRVSARTEFTVSAEATVSPPPLLPVHRAYSITLDWKAGEGLSVTTRHPSGQDQTIILGFWFLNQLGLGPDPSPPDGVASVPLWPVATVHERWDTLDDQMASLLLNPSLLAEIDSQHSSQPDDVRLDINAPMLSQFPWEFVRRPEGEQPLLSALPGVRHLYRSAELPGGDSSTIRWVQSVIRRQFDRGIEVDGADSPRLRNAIRSFQAHQGLEVTGVADAHTRWALDRSWRAAVGQDTRSVLLITSDPTATSYQGTPGGSRIQVAYQQCGYDVIVVSSQGPNLSLVGSQLERKALCFIHLSAPLATVASLGVVFALTPVGQPGSGQDDLTPKRLDEFLKSLPETDLKPVIVLDPPQPSSPFEAVLQLFLRNAFAAELFRLGSAPVVLATGLAELGTPEHMFVDLIRAASEGCSIGEVLTMIRRHILKADQPKISDLLWPIGTALFAHDPDTRAPGAKLIEQAATAPAKREYISRNVYALLVGIDEYPAPVPRLRGCVNDIKDFERYLMDRVGKAQGVALSVRTLLNGEATRQTVIDGFRNHLGKAAKGDVAIFYFSGEGSLEQSPPEFWHLEPDRLDRTLVCHDSRLEGSWDLADKELAKLIDEVSAREPHFALFVDSCFSGSGTRGIEVSISPRRSRLDRRVRPIDSFLVSPAELEPLGTGKSPSGWQLKSRKSRYVLFTACRDEQEAREYFVDGAYRGAFSFFLSSALKTATGVPTYRDLLDQVQARVVSLFADQTPQMESTRADDLDAPFLDGAIQPRQIEPVPPSRTSALPLTFVLEGDERACAMIRRALASSVPAFVREDEGNTAADFTVLAQDGRYLISHQGRGHALVPLIDTVGEEGARRTVQRLEHMARWTRTVHLGNPSSSIQPGDVELTILVDSKAVPTPIRLEYQLREGLQVAPIFQISVTNKSRRTLYCALLDLTQRFEVNAGLFQGGGIKVDPGFTAWAHGGESMSATVPEDLWRQGVIEYQDLLKLIVSTREFDARLLEQPPLDQPRRSRDPARDRSGTLNRTLHDLQTGGVADVQTEEIDDWRTSAVALTTIRRQPAFTVPTDGSAVELIHGVTLHGHARLKASARLSTEPLAMRELAGVRLPRLLTEDPDVCVPLILASPPGGFPGLSVLELVGVNDPSVVTQEQPLRLTVPLALGGNESVVAVAYDGEFFLPIGRVDERRVDDTVIRIDRLPATGADGRTGRGAAAVFLEKVVRRRLEPELPLPLLSAVEAAQGGTVTRFDAAAEARGRVASASHILLLVPGIVGDSQNMVSSVQLATLPDGRSLAKQYDLVLIFDYDPLHTAIDEAARALKHQMEAVGLGPGHGKSIDLVAHSTGGLLARWYIEREGGNQIIGKLVMLGTPNGGWPWLRFDDWASVVLGMGLNQFTTIAWPASAISSLVELIEHETVVPEEISRSGRIIEELRSAKDPGIPYILLGGTAAVNRPTSISTASAWERAIDRLITRIVSEEFLLYRVSPIVLEVPSDIALTPLRMEDFPAARKPPCKVRWIASDHLSYFTSEAGLKALAQALAP